MPNYLVTIFHPDDYNPALTEDEAMDRAIDELNDEMVAAGIRVFVGGLHPAKSARSMRAQANGEIVTTDGSYLQTKEHIGGLWVLQAASLDEALAWGRKAAVACRTPVEVRAFH
ncbi:MAG TPA: YciI family protein [Opitutaceae bacterium]